jgi:hypothetical protein
MNEPKGAPRQRAVFPALEPYAVTFDEARRLLGNKGRNQLYEAIRRREVDAIQDGSKMLITVESIRRRQKGLPAWPDELVEPPKLVEGKAKKKVTAARTKSRSERSLASS